MNDVQMVPRYLQKALDGIRPLVASVKEPDSAPIASIIARIADVDEPKSVVIARTLAHQQVFDSIVAEQVSQTEFSARFLEITEGFDSIRKDAERMVVQAEKDGLELSDRISNILMKITRGDISDRFDRISDVYLAVIADVHRQVEHERVIIDAYRDFRMSIKEAELLAHEIKATLEKNLDAARVTLQKAIEAVAGADAENGAERARLELARDEAQRDFNAVDERYQIAKDLAENLTVSYSVTEVTMAKLVQAHTAKDRLYKQAVTFFSTNSSVLSALKATYTGLLGLNEATKTVDAMHKGISKSLESIAEVGTTVTEEALRKGYGPGIEAASVRRLVDAVVSFQENSTRTIAEMRELSHKNAEEIRSSVEEGKARVARLLAHAPADRIEART